MNGRGTCLAASSWFNERHGVTTDWTPAHREAQANVAGAVDPSHRREFRDGKRRAQLRAQPVLLLFTLFVGLNLLQSALTHWCLMEKLLVRLGVGSEAAGRL
jgi:DUF2892 family protein